MESEKLFKVLASASFTILISAFTTTIKKTWNVFLILELFVVAVILAFDDYTLRKKFNGNTRLPFLSMRKGSLVFPLLTVMYILGKNKNPKKT